jgi:hypothetical protein
MNKCAQLISTSTTINQKDTAKFSLNILLLITVFPGRLLPRETAGGLVIFAQKSPKLWEPPQP